MAQQNEWSPTAETTLRKMFGAGASASVIADAINKTRSAVCGKISRLNLRRESKPILTKAPPRQTPRRAIPEFVADAVSRPVSILDVKDHQCRAPLDQRDPNGLAMFCGARKVPGSSWCARHKRKFVTVCYVPRRL